MTKAEALKMIESGEPMFLVEYRSSKCEKVEWRNKDTGRPDSFVKVTHNVEMGNLSFPVSERAPDGTSPETYKPPFNKGQRCALHVSSFGQWQGKNITAGRLEPLAS